MQFVDALFVYACLRNRFSYVINLKGPSFIVNTACSASLVALHSAKTHLIMQEEWCVASVELFTFRTESPAFHLLLSEAVIARILWMDV